MARRQRYQTALGLSAQDAVLLVSDRDTADYFEATMSKVEGGDRQTTAKLVANWINGELAAALNRAELEMQASPVSAAALAGLVNRVIDKTLSSKLAKDVFEGLWKGEGSADEIIDKRGLRQISDGGAIEKLVDDVSPRTSSRLPIIVAASRKPSTRWWGRS